MGNGPYCVRQCFDLRAYDDENANASGRRRSPTARVGSGDARNAGWLACGGVGVMMGGMSEGERDELVRSAAGGDGDALQRLLVCYHATLRRVVARAIDGKLRRHVEAVTKSGISRPPPAPPPYGILRICSRNSPSLQYTAQQYKSGSGRVAVSRVLFPCQTRR